MIRPALVLLSCAGMATAFSPPLGAGPAALRHPAGWCGGGTRRPPSCCPHPPAAAAPLRMAVDAAEVKSLVDKAQAADGPGTAPKKVSKALKKPTGALTVSIGYSNKGDEGKQGSLDFESLSTLLRKDKTACLLADISTDRGLADLESLVKEQSRGKGNFPGPCPIIASGSIESLEMAAKARAAGAEAVYVPSSMAEGLIGGCHAIGLEVVVEVGSGEEIEAALAAGAKILCVSMGEDTEGQVALRGEIPKDIVALAALQGRAFGGPEALFKKEEAESAEDEDVAEILQAGFKLRDAKFNGILVMEACTNADNKEEATYARWLAGQLSSKRSATYNHLAKVSSPLGTGRPPAPPGGLASVLPGSRPAYPGARPG